MCVGIWWPFTSVVADAMLSVQESTLTLSILPPPPSVGYLCTEGGGGGGGGGVYTDVHLV